MKRAYRDRALNQLYADVESSDCESREFAMLQLALLLRRRKGELAAGDWSERESQHLSRQLRRIQLSKVEETQAVACLTRVAARHADSRATVLWVMGEASAEIGFPAVLAAIRAHGNQLADEAAYQACRALQAWLEAEDLENSLAKTWLSDLDPLAMLARWSASTDFRLAKSATAVIGELRRRMD
ncbi:MAG: hypothetical protein OXG85_13820 [Chloroflexi bacterium]|nr:hypothetical protein [Chloroflexota bacterium]